MYYILYKYFISKLLSGKEILNFICFEDTTTAWCFQENVSSTKVISTSTGKASNSTVKQVDVRDKMLSILNPLCLVHSVSLWGVKGVVIWTRFSASVTLNVWCTHTQAKHTAGENAFYIFVIIIFIVHFCPFCLYFFFLHISFILPYFQLFLWFFWG